MCVKPQTTKFFARVFILVIGATSPIGLPGFVYAVATAIGNLIRVRSYELG